MRYPAAVLVRAAAVLLALAGACDIGLAAVEFDCGPNESLTRDGTCRTVGVPAAECTEAPDGEGGCVITFDEACAGLSLPGGGCQPQCTFVPDPANPGFPMITPLDTPTETVDFTLMPRVYVPSGASIAEAIATALPEPPADVTTVVVLGPGVFAEDVVIDRPIVLWGACPDQSTIVGQDPDGAVITLRAGVPRSGLAFVRVTGPGGGVRVEQGTEFGLGHAHLDQLGGVGLRVDEGASGYAVQTRVTQVGGPGVQIHSAQVLLRDSVIARARVGVVTRATTASESPGLTLERSVVFGATEHGVLVEGGTASLSDTLVRDSGGIGVRASRGVAYGVDAHLELVRAVVEGSHDAGVEILDATVAADRTTIRDTAGRMDALGASGQGCGGHGLRIVSGEAGSSSSATSSSITHSRAAGVFASGAQLQLSAVLVRDTRAESCSGDFGDGLQLYAAAGVTLEGVRVEDSDRAALAAFGADAYVSASVFGCAERTLAIEDFGAAGASVDESGASVCGCTVWERCRPTSHGLAPWVVDPGG